MRVEGLAILAGGRPSSVVALSAARCPLTGKNVNPFTTMAIYPEFVEVCEVCMQKWANHTWSLMQKFQLCGVRCGAVAHRPPILQEREAGEVRFMARLIGGFRVEG